MAADPLTQAALVTMAHALHHAAGFHDPGRLAEILGRLTAAVAVSTDDPREFLDHVNGLADRYAEAEPPGPDWRDLAIAPDGRA